ncbi:MAG: glycosyltransferase family 2 protein [Deltaproteobacteria bacterium]|nr:glycosyltransferase family 2 protein [Deltaproteobacteria bacterium]
MITVSMITMNEEAAVGLVIDKIKRVVPDAEILIVDSSSDRTPDIAAQRGARVFRQFPPRGYGPAMELALRSAGGDVIVTMDCDDTYPTDQIPVLAGYILQDGYDVVDGSRLGSKPKAMPMINYLANAGFALVASALFLRRFTDLHSGMRAYRKSVIDALPFDARGAALPVDLLLVPFKRGYKIKLTRIDYFERVGKSTMRPIESAWWTVRRIVATRFAR